MNRTERMTDRARRVMAIAEKEACARGAAMVAPEHLLLGLALEPYGIANQSFRNLGVSPNRIAEALPIATTDGAPTHAIPWAPATEAAVARAYAELATFGQDYVGTEHLVLGVIDADEGLVPQVLVHLGLAPAAIRREVYEVLGHV